MCVDVQVLQVAAGELLVSNDLDLAISLLADLNGITKIAGTALDFDAVMKELLEGLDVEDLVVDGLRTVDDELYSPISNLSLLDSTIPSTQLANSRRHFALHLWIGEVRHKLTFFVTFWFFLTPLGPVPGRFCIEYLSLLFYTGSEVADSATGIAAHPSGQQSGVHTVEGMLRDGWCAKKWISCAGRVQWVWEMRDLAQCRTFWRLASILRSWWASSDAD